MQDYSYHKMVANFPGIYTDLTDSGLDWDKFSGGKLADSTVDGHHYGLPFDNGASVMAVRSDMIENAGLTVDDFKDLTWSEFEEKAQKVVDANGVPMLTSSGGSELIIEMMQSAGASPVVDGEVKIADNAALKESLTVYKDMVDKGILAEYTDWDQYIASMNDGKAAGVINGCWIMSSVQAAADQSGKVGYREYAQAGRYRRCHQLRKLRRRKLGRFLQLQEHRAGLRLPEEHLRFQRRAV